MNSDALNKIRDLVNEVMYSSTNKDAQGAIRRLEFMASGLRGDLDGYSFGKLSEVIGYAKEASGQVKNKEHWVSNVEQSWYVFENCAVTEESPHTIRIKDHLCQ